MKQTTSALESKSGKSTDETRPVTQRCGKAGSMDKTWDETWPLVAADREAYFSGHWLPSDRD
jgi:hypothetical protein